MNTSNTHVSHFIAAALGMEIQAEMTRYNLPLTAEDYCHLLHETEILVQKQQIPYSNEFSVYLIESAQTHLLRTKDIISLSEKE